MFGKRKTPVPAAAGRLRTIIVPRSAVEHAKNPEEAHKLVGAVIQYANTLMSEGIYNRTEIPALAVQAYHADYYLAQVNNGGHAQFIHNSGDNLKHCLVDIPPALSAMKAEAHLAVFLQMKAWVDQFADFAAMRAAPNDNRVALNRLDSQFHTAEKAASMSVLSARWIESWPELKVVEDAEYREAIRQITLMNPLREQRLVWDAVQRLQFGMTDLLHVAISMACQRIQHPNESPEYLLKVAYQKQMEVDGKVELAWLVSTNMGPRYCVVSEEHVTAYQCIEPDNPSMPKFGDLEGIKAAIRDGRLEQIREPIAGNRLSQVPMQLVADIIELAKSYKTAAGLDLLLRRAEVDAREVKITPVSMISEPRGTFGMWLVVADRRAFKFEAGFEGSGLFGPHKQCLGFARRKEIDAHAAKAAAGSASVA